MEKINGVLRHVGTYDLKLLQSNPDEFWKDVEVIGQSAFTFAGENPDYIRIPGTVKRIEKHAFPEISAFTKIEVEEGVEFIDAGNISGYRLKEFILPSSTKIEYSHMEYYRLCFSSFLDKKDEGMEFVFFVNNQDMKKNGRDNYIKVEKFYKVFQNQMQTFHYAKFIEHPDITRILIRVVDGMDQIGITNNLCVKLVPNHVIIPTQNSLDDIFAKNHELFIKFVNSIEPNADRTLNNKSYFKLYNLALKMGLMENENVKITVNGKIIASKKVALKVLEHQRDNEILNLLDMDQAAFFKYDEKFLMDIVKKYGLDSIFNNKNSR